MKKNVIILILLALATGSFAQQANISYEVRIGRIHSTCGDALSGASCWEITEQEYTGKVNFNAPPTSCYTLNVSCSGDYGQNGSATSVVNTPTPTYSTSYDIWESDTDDRCNFNDGDDCHAAGSFNSPNMINAWFPSPFASYTNNFDALVYDQGASQHYVSSNNSWRYAGTANEIIPTCVVQSAPYSAGGIRSWTVFLTAGVNYNFRNCGSVGNEDTEINLYSANGYTVVATDDDGCGGIGNSSLNFTPATTGYYYLEITHFNSAILTNNGTLLYNITTPPAINNSCANAIALTSGSTLAYNTICATQDAPAQTCGGTNTHNDVWYSFTPSTSGTITVNNCGQNQYDSRISVYSGSCGALTNVGCSDDACGSSGTSSSVTVPVCFGLTYYISVGGFGGAVGFGNVNLTFAPGNTLPTITCPSNITVNTATNTCAQTVSWTAPVGTDACPGTSTVQTGGAASGSSFPKGTSTITYRVTDADGATATCSFNVTVNDNQVPAITCPSNINVNVAPGTCAQTATWTPPTGTDNCTGQSTAQVTAFTPGQSFPRGTSTITYRVTDAVGLSATCSFQVIVTDNEVPAITCPGNISVNTAPNLCTQTASWTAPVGTDNCTGQTTTQVTGLASGSSFPKGVSTITYRVTDAAGLSATCSFTVTVTDIQGPAITCPGNIAVNTAPNVCTQTVSFATPAGTDNCPGQVTIQTNGFANGSAFPKGTTINTYQVTDAVGLTATCSFTVTVTDNQPPSIICPGNISVNVAPGTCAQTATWTPPSGTDNCPGQLTAQITSFTPGQSFPKGVATISYIVIDAVGQSSSCSFTVTVVDNIVPEITCPGNIAVNVAPGTCSQTASWTAPVGTDNCPGQATIQTAGLPSGSSFPKGVSTITYRVTDAAGLTATCSFNVTVTDNESPTITCPANISVDGTSGADPCTAPVSYTAPVGTDNCAGASTVRTAGLASGSLFPEGINTVTFTVTDAVGLTASCSFTITVGSCNEPPVALCQDVTVNADANCLAAVSALQVDNGSFDPDNDPLTYSLSPVGPYLLGNTPVTLTVSDGQLSSSCTATITVQDATPPTINCPANISVPNDPGVCGAAVSYTVTSSDNCGTPLQVQTGGTASGGFFPVGTITNVFRATDGAGLTSTCSFTVTVSDTEDPVALCQDVTVQLNASGNGSTTAAAVNNNSTDNCGIQSLSLSQTSFTCADVGSNTVTLTVNDIHGNSNTCTANVEVEDNIAPVANCQDVTVQLNATGNGNTTATAVNNNSTDACGIQTLSLSRNTFACADVGSNTVTLTVTDVNGNSNTCTANVEVEDNVAPVALCQDVTVQLDANGIGSTTAGAVNNGSTDACGIRPQCVQPQPPNSTCTDGLLIIRNIFGCSDVGENPTVLTVTDVNGNSSTCSAIIYVEDNVAPVANCQDVTVQLNATGNGSTTATAVDNNSSDACGIQTLSLSKTAFNCTDVGSNAVTLTVTDVNGNSSTCTANVEVEDNVPPVALCQDVTVQLDASGNGSTTAIAVNNNSSDACGIQTLSLSETAFNCTDVGSNTVILTATDVNGNSSTCTANVEVEDNVAPVANCQNISIALSPGGTATITAAQVNNNSTDACGIQSLSVSPSVFNCTHVGNNTVTLTVTDVNGNVSTCTAVVNVSGGPLFGYVMVASEEVHLHKSNVQSGGIGITTSGGKAVFHDWTTVTAPGTFVISPKIEVGSSAAVTNRTIAVANVPLPPFETNPYTSNNDVKVLSFQTVTLTDSIYNKVTIEKFGTAIFTSPVVNIAHLDAKDFTAVKFRSCAKVRIKEHMHIKRNSLFNPDKLDITVFAEKHVDVKEGAKVYATIYTKDNLDVKGQLLNPTTMTGLFVAKKIDKGEFVVWNANTQCGKCSVVPGLTARIIASTDVDCDAGINGSLTVGATGGLPPYTYSWSNGQTGATASNLAPGVYSVTVTDFLGATAVVNAEIIIFTYTILAKDEIKLGKKDSVYSGSVGTTYESGKIDIGEQSGVIGDNSMVIAPILNIHATSTVNDEEYGIAPVVMAAFESTPNVAGVDLTVPNNATVTLAATDTLKRKIVIGENATLVVTAGILNITDKLEMKKGSKLRFTQACSKVRIKLELNTEENATINAEGKQVTFHIRTKAEFKKGAKVTATIFVPNGVIKTENASASAPNIMKGKFIGKKVEGGDYTYWHQSTACPCAGSSGGPVFLVSPPVSDNGAAEVIKPVAGKLTVNAYPNPFSTTATISFTLPQDEEQVRLVIYNTTGSELKQLYNGPANGMQEYKFEFNAENHLPSGIYFYRLETGSGETVVNKLVLAK